jgi:hypothetical protein
MRDEEEVDSMPAAAQLTHLSVVEATIPVNSPLGPAKVSIDVHLTLSVIRALP